MKRIAIVVQRWDADLAGGSEQLAWLYAQYLRDCGFRVDLLTTTARDARTWANDLPAGSGEIQGIQVRRFRVSIGRSPYWERLHDLLLREYETTRSEAAPLDYNFFAPGQGALGRPRIRWPVAKQEEWIRQQGPHSEDLLGYLSQHRGAYDAFVFMTYLYSPVYFGAQQVPADRSILIPTLHDEAPAYLPVFQSMARRFRALIWNMPAERRLGQALWGPFRSDVIHAEGGMGIESPPPASINADTLRPLSRLRPVIQNGKSFALYCGRISSAKGCADMIRFFLDGLTGAQARSETTGKPVMYPELLVLTGDLQMELPRHAALFYAGFVPEEQKLALMAQAAVLIMPSPMESLSIVTLEALGQGTPVLANAGSAVLQEHVLRSGAGRLYHDALSFARHLQELGSPAGATDPSVDSRTPRAAAGRLYVQRNYSHERVRQRVAAAVRAVSG